MNSVTIFRIVVTLAALVVGAGCGGGRDDAGPPEIHFGQDTCHACGMIIEDERYAAAVTATTAGGVAERYLFDDVGEMLEFVPPAGAQRVRRFVRDADTKLWADAASVTFVKTRDLHTPMGSGIAAYATPQAARAAIAAHGGTVIGGSATSSVAGTTR